MDIEDSHYWPTFIAKDVNELRNLPNVRQTMLKFRHIPILDENEESSKPNSPKDAE